MDDRDWLARRFEDNRQHLRAVAYRMLGSSSEADDAVQEAWLRLDRAGAGDVQNFSGWLTTVVARVCLDMLRSRKSRREESLDAHAAAQAGGRDDTSDPELEAMLADSMGPALLIVLDTLSPAERVAFVLHDMFAVPFREIAPVLGRTPSATKQLASRARRRVQRPDRASEGDRGRQREIVDAFLAASRNGDFEALLSLLDPDVIVRSDRAAEEIGAPGLVRGARAVANTFTGRAKAAKAAIVNGAPAAVWAPGDRPRVVFLFSVTGSKISAVEIVADAERLDQADVVILGR